MLEGHQGGEIDPIGWEGDLPTLQELDQQQQEMGDTQTARTFDHAAIMYGTYRSTRRTPEGYTIGWGASFNDPWSDVPETD